MAVESVAHPNGLSLALPPNLRATRTPEGFVVEPDPPQDPRSPVRIRVALTPSLPEMRSARETTVEGQPWNYAVNVSEAAGSGGPEFTLTACRRALGQWVCLWQTHRTQRGDQDFELWTVARGLRAG